MARNSTLKVSGPARIRLVVFDAEIPDGDVGSVTQVIQNALRAPATVVRMPVNGAAKTIDHQPELEPEPQPENDPEQIEQLDVSVSRSSKSRGLRKPPPTPDVVDIDMAKDVSLAAFCRGKDSSSQHKKYLIAAAWLKECRKIDSVTAGHIYTCFRSMGWPTNIQDFWQPLRSLKSKRFFTTNEKGEYEINHLGLAQVQKFGGERGTS